MSENMIQNAMDQVEALVLEACRRAQNAGELPAAEGIKSGVEIPKDTANGDFSSSFAMAAARAMRMAPRTIAQKIQEYIQLDGSYFQKMEIAGPGFLNFTLTDRWYGDVLAEVEQAGENYGALTIGNGQKVMVEFVSANPTGTMTIGNARGGVLGDVLASILERAGYEVHREFYVNNAGNQVELFGRSMEARYLQHFLGEEAVPFPEEGYHGDDIRVLAGRFIEQNGDRCLNMPSDERCALLREFGLRENIAGMERDLARYGIHYDKWFLESTLHESGYVDETIQMLIDAGYTYEKDGALWFKVTELGGEKDEVLRRSTGGYTYFAVDMAYHRNKFEVRNFDQVIDVLGADHHGHALRFKAGITALGIDNRKLNFLIMQLVRLVRDGETVKVSKRSGKVITLADLLDEIPTDAARFWFNSRPGNHLEFDLDLAVRQDSENPVYYVQYAHARICSLLSRLAEEGCVVPNANGVDPACLDGEEEHVLIKTLAHLPEEIRLAARDYDPSRINRYLTALAGDFHRFYNAKRIKGESEGVLQARLKLADTVRSVLANCLHILGISAPEQM